MNATTAKLDQGAPRRRPEVRVRKEQQRTIETRERIVEAAIVEFAAHGFEGVSTRNVAKRAEAKHTLITYHFEGKEGLWRAVLDRVSKSFINGQFDRLDALRAADNVTRLRELMSAFVRYSAENLNLHKVMSHAAKADDSHVDALVTEYLRPYFDMIADLIRAAQAEGAFVAGDPHHLHYLFIGAATRIFMQASEARRIMGVSPEEPNFVQPHIELCLALFFRPTTPKRRRKATPSV
jgi:TetR/AcrR family transcriptional regulator